MPATVAQHCRARNSITWPASNMRAHSGVNSGTHSSGTMVRMPTCLAGESCSWSVNMITS